MSDCCWWNAKNHHVFAKINSWFLGKTWKSHTLKYHVKKTKQPNFPIHMILPCKTAISQYFSGKMASAIGKSIPSMTLRKSPGEFQDFPARLPLQSPLKSTNFPASQSKTKCEVMLKIHFPSFSIIFHHFPSCSIMFHHFPSCFIIFHDFPSFTLWKPAFWDMFWLFTHHFLAVHVVHQGSPRHIVVRLGFGASLGTASTAVFVLVRNRGFTENGWTMEGLTIGLIHGT